MRLIYIDEAGNTGARADPDQPLHMIGSLIVEQAHIRPLEIRLNDLAAGCASSLLALGVGFDFPPFGLMPLQPEALEFHDSDLFGGNRHFRRLPPAERIKLCEAIIAACKSEQAVFGSCTIDKMKLQGGHPHMRCFQFTLERLQDYLADVDDLGLIVADEHRELEEELIRDLAVSRDRSTGWGWRPTKITAIVDTVHFVKSRHNRLVQACDVLTYFRLKGERVNARIRAAWEAAGFTPDSKTWLEFKDRTVTVSERAVLSLHDQVKELEHFSKRWPLN